MLAPCAATSAELLALIAPHDPPARITAPPADPMVFGTMCHTWHVMLGPGMQTQNLRQMNGPRCINPCQRSIPRVSHITAWHDTPHQHAVPLKSVPEKHVCYTKPNLLRQTSLIAMVTRKNETSKSPSHTSTDWPTRTPYQDKGNAPCAATSSTPAAGPSWLKQFWAAPLTFN